MASRVDIEFDVSENINLAKLNLMRLGKYPEGSFPICGLLWYLGHGLLSRRRRIIGVATPMTYWRS